MRIYLLLLLLAAFLSVALGQTQRPGGKPVLIRDDEPEKVEEVIVHSPAQARKSVSIGDFYYKRNNYRAAEERYREAIEYDKKWHESYEKLIKTLEKAGNYTGALEACLLYETNNPDSPMIREFKKRAEKIQEEIEGDGD